MEDSECIYDEVRQLVAVSPEKTQYDSKERVLFVFNKPLPVDGGPYEVEFKGDNHCLRVPAVLVNSCTIQAHAPVYYPPGKTTVTIYDKIKQHDSFIAECSFEFVSRNQILADVLEKATDPQQLLCDSYGISTADIKQFDEAMAQQIQQKAPNNFHLLDDTQTFPGKTEEDQTNCRYPTLIHFGVAYGLMKTVAACLRYCPAALKACALKNIDGLCPKEMAVEHGYLELSEDLQDFELHESSNPIKDQPKKLPDVTTYNNVENEAEYEEMSPTDLAFKEPGDDECDYVKMAPKMSGYSKNEIRMTPELWKAIFIAEKAVNESWRNNRLGEETVKAFSQFIQKSARQHSDSSSPTYDVPPGQLSAPALPPKFCPMNKKRHSIHDIPNSAPPLPPRSPLSPRSPTFFNGFGRLVAGDRRGSDPNIFHNRMQQNFDKHGISDETASQRPRSPDQPPELPVRTKSLLPARALGGLANERRGSHPNLSGFRTPHCDEKHGSFNEIKPGQVVNGLQPPNPDLPNGFQRPKSNSLDETSMGLSPRLPPRQPRPNHRRQRTASCEPALPTYSGIRSRTLSEPDEDGYMTVTKK